MLPEEDSQMPEGEEDAKSVSLWDTLKLHRQKSSDNLDAYASSPDKQLSITDAQRRNVCWPLRMGESHRARWLSSR